MERTVLHCDCDGFFASVECILNPELKKVPMAVGGNSETRHGIILAKNELAKKYNITTGEPVGRAKNKCPELVIVPPHHDIYQKYSDMVNEIYLEYTDLAEKFGIDETWLDVTGSKSLFGDGKTIADTIRERTKKEIGLTVSVGVSFNKIFAKLGSDCNKPDGTTVILRENFKDIVYPMPVEALLFVGKKTVDVLKRMYINTIGDLANADPLFLKDKLGKMGEMLWIYANGEDNDPVKYAYGETEIKSVGKGMTFPVDLFNTEKIRSEIYKLSDNVATRLRKHNKKCTVVQVHIKSPDFKIISKQKTVMTPTFVTNAIADCAYSLYCELRETMPVIRSLTVTAANLVAEDSGSQLTLTDTFSEEKKESLENAVDKLRDTFGKGIITRGSNLRN